MAVNIARFAMESGPRWGVVQRKWHRSIIRRLSDDRGADRAWRKRLAQRAAARRPPRPSMQTESFRR